MRHNAAARSIQAEPPSLIQLDPPQALSGPAPIAAGAVLCAMAAYAIVTFFALVSQRLFYPLELDVIEGVMMDHIVRSAEGKPIYVAPSLDFIPLAYMPLFSWLSGWLVRVMGPELWVPRLVSFVSVAGTAAIVFQAVSRETRSAMLAVGAVGLYLMGFGVTGSCYDVARPDSMMLVLAFAGLATIRWWSGPVAAIVAGLLFTLAFFTKQHAIWFALASFLHLVFNHRRRLLPFVLTLAVGCLGGYAIMAWWLGPWFAFYTWTIPSGWSDPSLARIVRYLGNDVFGHFGLLTAATLFATGFTDRPWRGPGALWFWAALGAIGTGLMATLDPWAYSHVLMGTLVAMAIVGPIAMHRLSTQRVQVGKTPAGLSKAAVLMVLSAQFLPLVYGTGHRLPREEADTARAAFIDELRLQPDRVMVPDHGFYDYRAGKPTSLHSLALDDLMRSRGNPLMAADPAYFDRLFEPLRSGPSRPVLVLDKRLSEAGSLWASLEPCYELAGSLGWMSEPLRPVAGNPFTPTYVYVPKSEAGRSPPARFSLEWASALRGQVSASDQPTREQRWPRRRRSPQPERGSEPAVSPFPH